MTESRSIQFFDVLITGAGFAGLCMAIKLKQQGKYSFAVLERGDQMGGTWRDNTYPGAACDVPSLLYSYSFETWPHWQRDYSPHDNIMAYMEHCVDRYGLGPHILTGQNVVKAQWLEQEGLWEAETEKGDIFRARFAIGSTGPLNKAKLPEIPGRENFAGPSWHTSHWQHDISLKGKRVAVIGTGASAIQVVPAIANEMKELILFQRTPPWVMPRKDKPVSEARRNRYRRFPWMQKLAREALYWKFESRAIAFVTFPGLMKTAKRMALRNLNKAIRDPNLRKQLIPDYDMGCKRVLRSDDYYPALTRKNVVLETESILKMDSNHIKTSSGKSYEVDLIVYATGFEAAEQMAPFEFLGRDGVDLRNLWAKGGEAYLGTTVAGFPNFFIVVGPNTGLGHNSIIHIIESQVQYIMSALDAMEKEGITRVEVKKEMQDKFNQEVQERLKGTIWNVGGCMSWYVNQEGKNTTLWPGYTWQFRRMLRRFHPADYNCS
ncbi:MAG: NAD(P)/FAD-dependent oxidoreductase [Bacteroidia bacterium]|nr:NAD(P)/FAD-dependent oxidoreductase [Bacteroidia bacterium]